MGLINNWNKLSICFGVLEMLKELGMKDPEGTLDHFPKGGLSLIQKYIMEVYSDLDKQMLEYHFCPVCEREGK
jgi:hypothetical protein